MISLEDILIEQDIVLPMQLQAARALQKEQGGKLEEILIGMGSLSEEVLQRIHAKYQNSEFYTSDELLKMTIDEMLFQAIPFQVALNYLILPVEKLESGAVLKLICVSPPPDKIMRQFLYQTQTTSSHLGLAIRDDLIKAIRYHYGRQLRNSSQVDMVRKANASQDFVTMRQEKLCINCGYPYESGKWVCSQCHEGVYDSSNDPLVGKTLGDQWTLIKLLGEGGMGLIYEGHSVDNESVAIKFLHTKLHIEEQAVDRFYHELQILRLLQHPNILQVKEFGFDAVFGFFIVMELLYGSSFDKYMQLHKKRPPFVQICKLIIEVCDAMDYAHQRNVIHRDLKPENIFLLGNPERIEGVKILDFGVAKLQHDSKRLTETGIIMGTPQYFSPEQALGEEIDQRSDIYSLTTILFEVLTGKELFASKSPYQCAMKHIYAPPPTLLATRPDLHFPRDIENLIQRGLSKNKDERPESMKEMKNTLRAILDQSGFLVVKPSRQKISLPTGAYSLNSSSITKTPSLHPKDRQNMNHMNPLSREENRTPHENIEDTFIEPSSPLFQINERPSHPIKSSHSHEHSVDLSRQVERISKQSIAFQDSSHAHVKENKAPLFTRQKRFLSTQQPKDLTRELSRYTNFETKTRTKKWNESSQRRFIQKKKKLSYGKKELSASSLLIVIALSLALLFLGVVSLRSMNKQKIVVPTIQKTSSVLVQTTPPGAKIWINDQVTSSRTPHRFAFLPGKLYHFAFQLPGYKKLSRWYLHEKKDGSVRIEYTLKSKIEEKRKQKGIIENSQSTLYVGYLTISCEPQDAKITVDSTKMLCPMRRVAFSVGRKNIHIQKEGFFPVGKTIYIEESKEIELTVKLRKKATK